MKAWWMTIVNGQPTIEQRETAQPVPGDHDVLIEVHAASLNRGEFIAGVGLHGNATARPAGIDAAGIIVALGAQVSGFALGDRVMGRAQGGFAQFARIHHAEAITVPAGTDFIHAAAFPLVFAVTFDMLVEQGGLRSGGTLLVTGASSGVGVACVQLGKALGATVIGASGSATKLERLSKLGMDHGILTRKADFAAEVHRITQGRGANLVIDNVGGTVFAECMRACGFQGRVAMVGYVDRTMEATIDIGLLHEQRLVLFGVSNKLRSAEQRAQTIRGLTAHVLPLVANGSIVPAVDRVFDFNDLPAAVAYMRSDAQLGKVVIAVRR